MKLARATVVLALLLGLGACASTGNQYGNRYYVAGSNGGGDYYLAPAPRDDYYGAYPFGMFSWMSPYGYCSWGPADCWYRYDDWRFFSFLYFDSYRYQHRYQPPLMHPPRDPSDQADSNRPRHRGEPRETSMEEPTHEARAPREIRESREPRERPAFPESAPRERVHERHRGDPPS